MFCRLDIDLHEARTAFKKAASHPLLKGESDEYEERLLTTHQLVVCPAFESAVVKIITKDTEEMTNAEKEAATGLLKSKWRHIYRGRKRKKDDDESDDDSTDEHGEPASPTKFLKHLKVKKKSPSGVLQSRYMTDLSWIHPTTVLVERLFSKCRHVLTYDRRRMLPRIFKAIVFLKENQAFWCDSAVQEMVAGLWDDRLGQTYDSDDESDVGEDY